MLSEQEILSLHPLHLAFVGDSVYTMLVRVHHIERQGKLKQLHQWTTSMVCAASQARYLQRLLPDLTDDEMEIVRRGRNAHARHTAPKSASTQEYAGSTALEALFGFLYLLGRNSRMEELFHLITAMDGEENDA